MMKLLTCCFRRKKRSSSSLNVPILEYEDCYPLRTSFSSYKSDEFMPTDLSPVVECHDEDSSRQTTPRQYVEN